MKGIKTEWNLGLLYKSPKDPQIEKDFKKIEKACAAFEKKYRNSNFTATPKKLAKALRDQEKLLLIFNGGKPWFYFVLRMDLDSGDKLSEAMATKNEARLTKASNRIAFFDLEIGKISAARQQTYLGSRELAPYRYYLKLIFDRSKYQLSEGEEQVINLLSPTSYGMWVDSQNKVLSTQAVKYKGKDVPLTKAFQMLRDLPFRDREYVHGEINRKLKEIASGAEAEYNAILNYKKVLDERRGYERSYSSTVLEYENEEKEIEQLVSTITKRFDIPHRFYRIHAKLLGKKRISYAHRTTKAGEIKKKYEFPKALSLTSGAFARFGKKYAEFVDNFAKNGQFDVYPRKGKTGGAYCWGTGDAPTFVLLNHTDNILSVETLGHEMGHAVHTEFSKSQPPRYQKYSMATAETASTFFEQLTTEELEKDLSEKEKIIFLHNKILGDIATIFRQIAFFNFEREMHERVRKEGQISKEDFASLMAKHLKSYLGNAVDVTRDDGYFFVYLSHARRFFYVYSYAYGHLISRALYENWKKDPSYAKKIEQFLSAGRSMSPKDIFKSIGIDTSDPKFFKAGLKGIEADIKKLEKLTERK